MKKTLLSAIALTLSVGAWADCETNNQSATKVATCFEKQSYTKVVVNLKKLRDLSKEQISYNPNILNDLNKSQATWIAYRDSYCTTYSNYHTEKKNHSNCIVSLNNLRADQLQNDIDTN